ncbi:relaxase (plasmid) [Lactiplantibacillus plantarum]|uniref:relaxase/mobilization nuclease domain-containing protein n=2 Tax=Lactiplantibacillus plantarum TaxID=1590 RepID=UPI0006D4B015|nr:relaxase/mobilization nuclease domain-containing protein [Lactiplantibacillus plantarum]ALG27477.1 relaxase [Lactiplantibacillus plantarum]
MPTIAKISSGASASSALNYALGKNKGMHNDTERWLDDHDLKQPEALQNCRAVAVGGTNGVMPEIAPEQFKLTREAYNQTQQRNQVQRIVQSFSADELDPTTPGNWQRANDLGVELAEKLYPDYQTAVYTHIDGQNHVLHNHIIVNKVNLETGHKLRERPGEAVERARQINDRLAEREHWQVITPVREHQSKTEQDLTKKGQYSYMHDLRSRIDSVMADTSVIDFKTFSERLTKSKVNVSVRGQNVSYAFLDANHKQRRARGKRLGADYDKEAILSELERRTRERTAQQLNRDDQSRADSALRETERTDTALEQRERQAQSRKPRIDQLRNAVKPIADHLQHFTGAVREFAGKVEQRVIDSKLYKDVASRFKADLAKQEQARQNAIKQDLAKRMAPKKQPQQPQRSYYREPEGRSR